MSFKKSEYIWIQKFFEAAKSAGVWREKGLPRKEHSKYIGYMDYTFLGEVEELPT